MADRSDIDEVRTRTDLVSVVERYVTLKRAGRQLKGLCPFHQEKTPSFVVSPEIGYWKCFGSCGEGGDVFKFVQKIENLTFPEALERLALQAGVTLTSRSPRAAAGAGETAVQSEAGIKDRLRSINGLALRFYRDVLARSPVAREYLQERGLAHAAQESFQLGFAADEWDGLCRFLTRNGVSMADAEKAGLVTVGERGTFDKMRGRLVFPILDVHERPIAFGGRLIGEAKPNQPKYWNSPETPLFSKSRELYGLWRAHKSISSQDQAIIVEGYTDVIACHQAGFENVVATLGTSLTEDHIKLLSRYTSKVILTFDADSAGLKAAFRAADMFEKHDVDVRVLELGEGQDPDTAIRSGKRLSFDVKVLDSLQRMKRHLNGKFQSQSGASSIEDALPIVEYRLKQLIKSATSDGDLDRVALFRKAVPVLAAIPTVLEREQYMKLLAPYHPHFSSGSVYAEEHIRQDVASYLAGQNTGRSISYSPPRALRPLPPPPSGGGATEKAERHLLCGLVSDDPALAGLALSEMTAAEFITEGARSLAAYLYDFYAQTGTLEPRAVLAALGDDPRADRLAELLMNSSEEPVTPESLAGEIAYLKDHGKEQTLSGLKARIMSGTADAETQRQFRSLLAELKGTPKSLIAREGK